MATENKPTPDEASYVVQQGSKTDLGEGRTRHIGRHPQSPDHQITVITAKVNNKPQVVSAKRDYLPMKKIVTEGKKREADAKARADKSKANRAAQLAKKRARTPKPKNK